MDERNGQKFPKETTFKKWREKFPWLKILSTGQQKKMICEIYTDQEDEANALYESDICKQKHKL